MPRAMIWFVAGLLRDQLREIGTRKGTRILTCFRQAVFILAWLRDGGDIERLGAGFGMSRATAYRRHREALDAIAAQAPTLAEVLAQAVREKLPYLILDGTLVPIDRIAETKTSVKGKDIDAWYSGKAREQCANIQALAYPDGIPAWTSDAHPGSEHDLTVARAEVLQIAYPYLGDLVLLADGGYVGTPHDVKTPVPQPEAGRPELSEDIRTYNRILRGLRFQGERGFALLFGLWKALRHVTMSPRRIGDLMRATLVLTQFEHKIIWR
ncbi:transposase family protein [Catenulispora sp. GP43]|uniref:transposase family protein n=1 Tax=Catenulispora sp. GP43 TaxID=3156263 RepID=UPI0035130DF6